MAESSETIRYIIVVHGIGEQRKGETAIEVANRFAEARRNPSVDGHAPSNILTLGKALSQTGKEDQPGVCRYPLNKNSFIPWMEFEDISQKSPLIPANLPPFYGESAKSGNNLRFVDMHWADIMQSDAEDVVLPVESWAAGLLGRIKCKKEELGKRGVTMPHYVIGFLKTMCDTLVFLNKALSIRYKNLNDLIFKKYLDDVQQYGEYAQCRGQAVRRFHRLMARVEKAHMNDESTKNTTAKYTIIAHSLGTVLSMDALLYAHLNQATRTTPLIPTIPNIPFPGYFKESGDDSSFLDTSWVANVDNLVTLGSPINKFLILYWHNYKYLLNGENLFTRKNGKVNLFNYFDEQDPVGNYLDIANTAPLFQKIFAIQEDIGFTRYPVPGAAHNEYWRDRGLFNWILQRAVDNSQKPPNKPDWFDAEVYKKVLRINYKLIPYTVIGFEYALFTWAIYGKSWHASLLAMLIFLAVCWLGRKMLDLLIWTRQVMRIKTEINELSKPPVIPKEKTTLSTKQRLSDSLEFRFSFVIVGCLLVGAMASGLFLGLEFNTGWQNKIVGIKLILLLVVALVVPFFWNLFFVASKTGDSLEQGIETIDNKVFRKITGYVFGVVVVALLTAAGMTWLMDRSLCDPCEIPLLATLMESKDKLLCISHILFNVASFTLTAGIVLAYVRKRLDFVAEELERDITIKINFTNYV